MTTGPIRIQLQIDGVLRSVVLTAGEQEGSFSGELDGEQVAFDAVRLMPGVVSLVLRSGPRSGQSFRCVFDGFDAQAGTRGISIDHHDFAYQVYDPRSLAARGKRSRQDEGTLLLKATMAGRVIRLLVEKGATVEAQAGIVVIEAMKMQNELRAQRAGRVVELRVTEGEMVGAGQVLAVIE